MALLPIETNADTAPRRKAVELARRTLALIEAKTTDQAATVMEITVDGYLDPDRFQRESAILFRERPVFAGFSGELTEPGQYKTIDLPGCPVVLVRQRDGSLRGFVNACRHRGARLVDGAGSVAGETFSCPSHTWCYGLDGALSSMRAARTFGHIDPDSTRLRPVGVAEGWGVIFIRAASADHDLRELDVGALLGEELSEQFEHWGFGDLEFFGSRAFESSANWKLVLDTQLEPFLSTVHPSSLANMNYSDHATFDAHGAHALMGVARKSIGALAGMAEEEWDPLEHVQFTYVLFPNTVLTVAASHVEYVQVLPGREPARTAAVHAYFTPRGGRGSSDERHTERYNRSLRTLVDESARLAENIQHNLTARAVDRILVGRNEPAVQHQYRMYDEALQHYSGGLT